MSQPILRDYWDEKVKSKLEQQTSWYDEVQKAMDEEKTSIEMNIESDDEDNWLEIWCNSHRLTYKHKGYWDGIHHVCISWQD